MLEFPLSVHPLLYELNTRCWLRDLSAEHHRPITLAHIPDSEFEQWYRLGFTHIWAMGVWTSGLHARSAAVSHPDQRRIYDEALPGWREADIDASPYAISAYRVPDSLGGEGGLRQFRQKLRRHGLKLILDFVPNHLGLDHPWLDEHPDYFVQSASQVADTFTWETADGTRSFAHGKDPGMPAWTDTIQVDYRVPAARAAMLAELHWIAARCDGVRCDMAMLLLNDVFNRTWHQFPAPPASPALHSAFDERGPALRSAFDEGGSSSSPAIASSSIDTEFWSSAISSVKSAHPDFLFLAEVYWNLEGRLQSLGFDFTYDKTLYDRLIAHDIAGVQKHLLGMGNEIVSRCAHFLENHDERRIASLLSPVEHRAAALLILALPGMRFIHERQLSGARIRIPVHMLRRPKEEPNPDVSRIYEELLALLPRTLIGRGKAKLLTPLAAHPNDPTDQDITLIQWQQDSSAFDLVAINLASHPSRCLAAITLPPTPAQEWQLKQLFSGESRRVPISDLQSGLLLDLPQFGTQIFHVEPT